MDKFSVGVGASMLIAPILLGAMILLVSSLASIGIGGFLIICAFAYVGVALFLIVRGCLTSNDKKDRNDKKK